MSSPTVRRGGGAAMPPAPSQIPPPPPPTHPPTWKTSSDASCSSFHSRIVQSAEADRKSSGTKGDHAICRAAAGRGGGRGKCVKRGNVSIQRGGASEGRSTNMWGIGHLTYIYPHGTRHHAPCSPPHLVDGPRVAEVVVEVLLRVRHRAAVDVAVLRARHVAERERGRGGAGREKG